MSRPVLHVYAAVVLGLISARADGGEPIQWAPDLENARAAAVSQNKLLLLHFWTPDCGPCKIVDQDVFPMPSVAEAINQNYIPLKVNAYRNRELLDHFDVDRWPTDIIATADGQTVFRMVTPKHPDLYVHELMNVIMKHRSSNAATIAPLASQQVQPTPTQVRSRQPNRWADGVEAPEISDNTARALRPGVDSQLVPGVNPDFRSDVADFGTGRFSASGSQAGARFENAQTNSLAAESPRFGAARDRFEATNKLRSKPMAGAAQIGNPYFQSAGHNNEVATYRETESLANAQRATAAEPSLPAREVAAASGIAREQRTTQARQNSALHNGLSQSTPGSETTQSDYPVGLDGRCPVTLITKGTWKKGDARWGAVHRGNLYLFAGAQEQQAFLNEPDEFSPVLAGMDVVRLAEAGKVVRGSRQFGVLFDDDGSGPHSSRIYLFDSVDSRNRFESTPDLFLRPVMEAMQRNALDTLLR